MTTIWNFIVNNWLYFVVGGCVLVVLLIVIITASCVIHKKKKQLKKQQELQKQQEELAQQEEPEKSDNVEKIEEETKQEVQATSPETDEVQISKQELNARLQELLARFQQPSQPSQNSELDELKEIARASRLELEEEEKQIAELQAELEEAQETDAQQVREQQIKTLMEFLNKKENDQIRLMKEIMQDDDTLKNISDKQFLDALQQIDNQNVKTIEIMPEEVVTEKPEVPALQMSEKDGVPQGNLREVPENSIILNASPKITFRQALNALSTKQKSYFSRLKTYADKKAGATTKETVQYLVVGVGNNPYIKFSIKKNILVASFRLENEKNWELRYKLGNKLAKPKETPIKILTDQDFENAKQLIDARVEQVASEKEYKKQLRNEKRRKNK